MKIAIFSECYQPVQNGVSTSVSTLVDELRLRRHHVFVIAPHFSAHRDSEPFIVRVPSYQTRFNPDYPLAFPWFPRVRRKFSRVAPDIIHSHSPFAVGLLAAHLAQDDGLPLVSTYHTLYNHYAHYLFFLPDAAIQAFLKWWIPDYYNRCAGVIVPSRVAEDSLRKYGVTAPITVVPTGVPIPAPECVDEAARRLARDRWNIPHDVPLLLYVGRIAREKNPELVMCAFSLVADEFRDARLLVVGGGPYLDECRERAGHLRNGDRILFAGPTPHEELTPVYAAADLFVFGSSTETQGLVIAEARAAGTPSVVVTGGGASETVRNGEDGLVVEPELGPFAEAMRSLLGDRATLARFSEACRRNALQFTPGAMAERVLGVYERALRGAPRSPKQSDPSDASEPVSATPAGQSSQ